MLKAKHRIRKADEFLVFNYFKKHQSFSHISNSLVIFVII